MLFFVLGALQLDRGTSQEKVTLMPDQPLPVYLIVDVIAEKNEASLIKATQDVVQHKISFQVGFVKLLCVCRALRI